MPGLNLRLVALLHNGCGGDESDGIGEPVISPLICGDIVDVFLCSTFGLAEGLAFKLPPGPARRVNSPPRDFHRLSFGCESSCIEASRVVLDLAGPEAFNVWSEFSVTIDKLVLVG
jgi:hypothetical protein